MNSGKKRPLKLKSYLKQSHSPSPSCVVLFCIVWLCFVVLFCIVWLCVLLSCSVLCGCVLLSCSVLCGCVFCCPVLYCVAVFCCPVLYCVAVCFVVLFCIVWLLGPFSLLFITDWQIVFYLMQDGKRQSAMNSGKNRPLKLVKELPKTKPQSQSCM